MNCCCKAAFNTCYFCNNSVCKNHSSPYDEWQNPFGKIKPRVCNSCTDRIVLIKWLDKIQYKALRVSKHRARYNSDPVYREKSKEQMRAYTRKNREKLTTYVKNRYNTNEEFRKKIREVWSKWYKERWAADPEFREKMREKDRRSRQKHKEKYAAKFKEKYYNNPEFREKRNTYARLYYQRRKDLNR